MKKVIKQAEALIDGEILEKKTHWLSPRWGQIKTLLKYILLGSCLDT